MYFAVGSLMCSSEIAEHADVALPREDRPETHLIIPPLDFSLSSHDL